MQLKQCPQKEYEYQKKIDQEIPEETFNIFGKNRSLYDHSL